MFTRALVRPPTPNFADGLTEAGLGAPDVERALAQHARYREALAACGLSVSELPPEPGHPDATFVEDTAIVTDRCAVLTRPGAPSRRGEVGSVRAALEATGRPLEEIAAPGTVDGGDVCEADGHFLVGVGGRTSEEGGRQLAAALARHGHTAELVDVRGVPGILHLKSGLTYLGEGRMAAIADFAAHPALARFEVVPVPSGEEYAANCLRLNARLLVASGFPGLAEALEARGFSLLPLDMSEFRRMDGALTCLSLRFS
jgi:dimethylargininase